MSADVSDCLNWNFGAGRVHRDAASVRVGDGDYIIHAREAGQDLVLYSLRGILHGRSNALHGGRDAQDVFRSHASVRIGKTIKRISR
jgi:hypothetical protein